MLAVGRVLLAILAFATSANALLPFPTLQVFDDAPISNSVSTMTDSVNYISTVVTWQGTTPIFLGNWTLPSSAQTNGFQCTLDVVGVSGFTLVNTLPVISGVDGAANNFDTGILSNPGSYLFTFHIPPGTTFLATGTIICKRGSGASLVTKTDFVSINVTYSLPTVLGDPQFVGLRGQSYQVHGIDGAVYNIISEKETQVNARFVYLNQGVCPILNGVADSNCWSHPGSYLGEMSFQQVVDGAVHKALVVAGSASEGFKSVIVDGASLSVGGSSAFGDAFSVSFSNSHSLSIKTSHFEFSLSNSDLFVNQGVRARISLPKLNSHGLLGQTHKMVVYPTSIRYIDGDVDDYAVADNDLFGSDFVFNQFEN